MPLQATSGVASYDGFGGGVAVEPVYIEQIFSTYLYTGNGSTQTITNNIDLSTKGGMVWAKRRDSAINHGLWSTTSAGNFLISNATTANTALATGVTAFSTTGFSLGSGYFNTNAGTYTSWSFKKQEKFFTQVTYTGTGSATTISHDLGATPAFIIVKRTDTTSNWACYHTSLGATQNIALNATAAAASSSYWNNTSPTSTVFSVDGSSDVNASGGTYIAYLFAHNAGGFGLTGTDNVISCGSVSVTNGSYADVNLGYEPQFVMLKASSTTGAWFMNDTMRGMPATPSLAASLSANSSAAEVAGDGPCFASSTGFTVNNNNVTGTYIYIAIRRGPMKVPTSGTSVFAIDTRNGTTPSFVSNFPIDMSTYRAKSGSDWYLQSRHSPRYMFTNSTVAETAGTVFSATEFAYNTGWGSSGTSIPDVFSYMFRRAPNFFDVVCYTGTGVARTVAHNLGAVPELMIVKSRGSVTNWRCYVAPLGNTNNINLDSTGAVSSGPTIWNSTTPTSSVFSVGTSTTTNASAGTYVAYLFATCAGVSKVGSYTGTATTKQVDCGFTSGARFVLIKRTDSSGAWYVWDSARGIVAGNDPYLLLNTADAEVTTTDYIDTYSAGFEISSTAPSAINASGGTFIFLAIA